ncbi:ketosteroid isomerase-like protein [Lentzea atacamensis]|uniref:Ketosteroid isomerase-like protein n=2 Tax=Lentzea TaxID=165301 RepID=A0A316I3C6_9PSEU|nr:nuclear transport factor 2 family protein [Lentzea atacamensis]PWK87896.1 ketosteroid isomerase-like protein [Lentzea atacamensis]RAS71382.1 ketosteroid isomerase-like protein [Lentzea atacamensis]
MLSTVEVVQVFLARLAAQDAPGIARLCAPTVEWEAPDPSGARWAHGPRTRREVESQFLTLFATFGLEQLSVRQVIVDGGDAAVVGWTRWRVLATGERANLQFAAVLSVHLGEIEQYWQMPDTLAVAVATGAARTEV